jgi:hypothetical protein
VTTASQPTDAEIIARELTQPMAGGPTGIVGSPTIDPNPNARGTWLAEDPETGVKIKVRKPPNKGLSKYRKGFPVKMSVQHVLMLHMTYMWMQKHGETTPALDELMKTLPPYMETKGLGYREQHRSKTIRVRGTEVPALITLMERGADLPFTSCGVFSNRIRDLEKLPTVDLMVDAGRE